MEVTLFDRTFRDGDGKLAIAQKSNLPLLVWLATTVLKLLFTSGNLHTGLDALAFGSLFWALGMAGTLSGRELSPARAQLCGAVEHDRVPTAMVLSLIAN